MFDLTPPPEWVSSGDGGMLASSTYASLASLSQILHLVGEQGIVTDKVSPSRSAEGAILYQSLILSFDPATAQAAEQFTNRLIKLLFDTPEEFSFNGDESRSYLFYVAEQESLEELRAFIQRFADSLTSGAGEPLRKRVVTDFLKRWMQELVAEVSLSAQKAESTAQRAAMYRWHAESQAALTEFDAALRRAADEILEQATEDTLRARDAAVQAAGLAGTASLGGHFKQVAEDENVAAMAWTGIAVGSLVAAVTVGISMAGRYSNADWKATVLHLALVLPVIGLSAYSARIAGHHRLLSRWAKTSAVQVNSVAAFAEQVPSESGREELILHLGRTVFGQPAFTDESKTENVSGIPPGLIELLKEVVKRDSAR